jgi:hypothetical protein
VWYGCVSVIVGGEALGSCDLDIVCFTEFDLDVGRVYWCVSMIVGGETLGVGLGRVGAWLWVWVWAGVGGLQGAICLLGRVVLSFACFVPCCRACENRI